MLFNFLVVGDGKFDDGFGITIEADEFFFKCQAAAQDLSDGYSIETDKAVADSRVELDCEQIAF